MIPTLLKPRFFSIKNRWKISSLKFTDKLRDLVLIFFAIFLVMTIFKGTLWSLTKIHEFPQLSAMPPTTPIGMVLLFIFIMLILSNTVSSLGAFYQSDDLETILASPIRPYNFFIGRSLQVFLSTSWMPFIFFSPFLFAFGINSNAPYLFYLASMIALIPLMWLATMIGVTLSSFLGLLVPASRTRVAKSMILAGCIYILYSLFEIIRTAITSSETQIELGRLIRVVAFPDTLWLPPRWFAYIIGSLLKSDVSVLPEIFLCVFSVISATLFAFLIVDLFHKKIFSLTRDNFTNSAYRDGILVKILTLLLSRSNSQRRALYIKELRLFGRDVGQILESALLFGICIIYLSNLKILGATSSMPVEKVIWWKNFLFLVNIGMVSFVITAISTRLAFSSISREGRSFWMLQTMPLDTKEYINSKFRFWFAIIGTFGVLFYLASVFVLSISIRTILFTSIITLSLCYSIVGAAIGFGGLFSRFDWEHPSELIAGFGSFVFMVYSCILILFSLLPAWIVLFAPISSIIGHPPSESERFLLNISVVFISLGISYLSKKWTISLAYNEISNLKYK